jgi:hypothetical protein
MTLRKSMRKDCPRRRGMAKASPRAALRREARIRKNIVPLRRAGPPTKVEQLAEFLESLRGLTEEQLNASFIEDGGVMMSDERHGAYEVERIRRKHIAARQAMRDRLKRKKMAGRSV